MRPLLGALVIRFTAGKWGGHICVSRDQRTARPAAPLQISCCLQGLCGSLHAAAKRVLLPAAHGYNQIPADSLLSAGDRDRP